MRKILSLKSLNRLIILIFIFALLATIFLISTEYHVVEGLNFGAGAYYYTDIPDWQDRFFIPQSLSRYSSPILIGSLFASWSLLCYKTLLYFDKKL